MFIKEIIVDGFKSYAQRTVIDGFDPHFNAITGLNGSGKSNILDSICFVLGITNLSQVRAGNLSELVYKQGQAGVNKATVTIVFSNDDPKASPVGYEQCPEVTVTRQVLIGGKSKYLINGRNAPAGQVQNLFHSVQLNVNNPHFLIMQGRITKVLNMKPHEILGMVEEAAGTRMYETKRVAALKTIDKKQTKLDELNAVLAEEITPTLERLRGEKQGYLKWSKNNADMQRTERFVIASEYYRAQQALENDDCSTMQEHLKTVDANLKEQQLLIKAKEEEISERSTMMSGEFGDALKQAKAVEEEQSKELVKITSSWQSCKDDVAKAESDLQAARALVEETKEAMAAKKSAVDAASTSIETLLDNTKEAEERLAQLTLDYQSMSAGISSSQGDEGRTLPEQISKAHSDSKTAEAKVKQAKMKIKHLTKEIKSVEKEIQKEGKSAEKLESKRSAAIAKVESIKAKIHDLSFSFSPEDYESFEKQKSELEAAVADLSERVEMLTIQLSGKLSFKYSDPVRGFDRSKVKGLVAKLVQVKDSKHATALELVAGGKLYNVVVDEAITGKALLDRGKLAKRVTIIPLDKIATRQLSRATTDRAASIASSMDSEARPAIELIGFDEEIRNAVEHVFGASIIADGAKLANEICDATKTRTITLEGDVYDPSGSISGGSKDKLGTTLSSLMELKDATNDLNMKRESLQAVSKHLCEMSGKSSKYDSLAGQLELAEAELQAALKHLSQTSFGMLAESRDSMSKELEEANTECVNMEKEQKEKWALYEELKEREADLTKQREERLANIELAVKDAKVEVAQKAKLAREAKSQSQTSSLELDSLQAEVSAAQEAVAVASKAVEDASNEEEEVQMKVGEIRALYEEARGKLDSVEKKVQNVSAELVGLKNQRADLVKAAEEMKLESKKLSVSIARVQKERKGAEKAVASLLKKHPWIESDMSAFNVPGGDYDFQATDPTEVAKQMRELKAEQEVLAKKINKKVMGMIEKAEGEYTELLRKRKVVENDKQKIQTVIEELDVKKKSELQRTWEKVNKDFGSIFSTLLPGAFAKLEPPEGMEAWEGLEVKVAFGQVWKDSLSELSGGQRSLLALSLILALLLFKPAPMYILDEVDAALDLSHTQNIGNMLRTHFSQSQFIVVSLKEGMFNNANVIFRTRFVDGVSTVSRTIGTGSSRARSALASSNSDAEEDVTKSARRGGRKKGKENAVA